jgi:hypothetical protein
MIKRVYKYLLLLFLVAGCKKSFEPIAITTDYKYLVVDGVINAAANSSTIIVLSRTKRLTDSTYISFPELNAQVTIEGEVGGIFVLRNNGNGDYISNPLSLNAGNKYRLRIKTFDGREYLSSFVPVNQTPAIDNISWQQPDDITVYVSTRDPQNNTRYYRWEFVETWEYNAELTTPWILKNERVIPKVAGEEYYTCWASARSSNILIGSSIKLTEDVISNEPIAVIAKGSEKGLIKYSILVKQYALTRPAYDYWQILQKNTQSLGSLFDPQPSQLRGNIQSVSNPGEPVIGFVSVCSVQEKRIFINKQQLTNWLAPPPPDCSEKEIAKNPLGDFVFTFEDTTYAPYYFISGGGVQIAKKDCLDCRRKGGVSVKPVFWQ